MTRRRSLATIVALLAALTLVSSGGSSSARRAITGVPTARADAAPNIVFIMVDDMRNDDLKYLPEVRRLIRDHGVRFTNSFSPYPLCCPARASVFSGLYSHNHGVYSVEADYGFHSFDDRQTLATMLRRAGYATVYLGKYLNRYGVDPPHTKTTGNSLHYVPPGWEMWRASLDGGWAAGSPYAGSTTYDYDNTTLSFNGDTFESLKGRYQTVAYGKIASGIIRTRAASDRPFLLYLSFTAPHSGWPWEPDDPRDTVLSNGEEFVWYTPARPRWIWNTLDSVVTTAPGASWQDPDISDKPAYLRRLPALAAIDRKNLLEVTRQRVEALTVVDQQVARVMGALEDTGELDQTLVVFTSDNGYFLGEQRMRLGKVYPHEASLRVPLLMRGPGIPAGATRRDPFMSVDYLPTIADATGATLERDPDGASQWQVACQGDRGWTRAVLTETGPVGHPPRDTDLAGDPLPEGGQADVRFLIGVRTWRYLYVDVAGQRDELYDLSADPQQYDNLVGDPAYAETEALLRQVLRDLRACRGAECRVPLPEELQRPA